MAIFEKINLESELFKLRENKTDYELDATLSAFKDLFRADWESENRIAETLDKGTKEFFITQSENLPANRIYSRNDIKALCLKYRLRFLPTKYFKGSFPPDAMRAIKETEKIADTEIKNFMIIAPSALFKLEDANKDPLLFVPLESDKYYLIHKWGNDLAWHRKLRAWPFRSFSRLVFSIATLATFISCLVPTEVLSPSTNFLSAGRFFFFLWIALTLGATVSFLWFTLNQKFSNQSWNSKTFN